MIKDLCFEITQKCPNNCMFCSSNSNMQKDNFIDFETIKKTIDFFMQNGGIKEISLSGGEPMLHPDIFDIIKYCHDRGIFTTLYTSGIVVECAKTQMKNSRQQENVEQQYKEITVEEFLKLKQAGLDKVVFDVQAANAIAYNLLMGTENNFKLLLKTLENVSILEKETAVHFVPNRLNVNIFQEVFKLAEKFKIDEVRILKFIPQGRGRENREALLLTDDELQEFIRQCMTIKSGATRLTIGIPLQKQNEHKCTAGFDKLDIRYDGQILPCPAFKDTDEKLLKAKGFKVINIFRNLEDFKFDNSASREIPLCQQINKERYF